MKKILFSLMAALLLVATSCSDFLERAPKDALSPATFWQTESDAYLALVGTYNGLNSIYHNGHWTGYNAVMMDALSDNLFDYFSWEGYSVMTTGNITQDNNGVGGSWYTFSDIRACNEYLEMEGNVDWTTSGLEEQYKAEVRTIRALLFLYRSNWYGDFPLVTKTMDLDEAYAQARTPKAEVQSFVESELKDVINALPDRSKVAQGRISKEFAQGLLMRYYLWKSDYQNAKTYAEAIVNQGNLSLSPDYAAMFEIGNQYDGETIFDFSFISNTARDLYGNPFVANGALGGWSSIVPTVDLMDEFECIDGKTIEESELYDPEHPFLNRDPRLRATMVYPGQVYTGYKDTQEGCYNPLPEFINGNKNNDWWNNAGNATKTGLQLGKYFMAANVTPESLSHMTLHYKAMRYAEVLLTLAECNIELGDLANGAKYMNMVRKRAGMPEVEVTDQATMRDQIRRERRVELGGEGLRREDMVRWQVDANGKWVASGGTPYIVWKFQNDYCIEHLDGEIENRKDANGDWVAHVTGRTGGEFHADKTAFARENFATFTEKNILWPISRGIINTNPAIKQTPGY
jgi:hypothetical protein